ncbi:MAG: hypothetical protein Q9218_006932 [Villophora microphyllina]
MTQASPLRILMLATALLLLFLNLGLGISQEKDPYMMHLLAMRSGERTEIPEMIEMRRPPDEVIGKIRMYPLHFTKAVEMLPTPILAQVLEQFYDELIKECEARIRIGVPIGVFSKIEINKLKLIVISSGRGLSWAFIIRFAQRMRRMIARNSGLSTYEAYYTSAPGDVMVQFTLQLVRELPTIGESNSYR